jgi:hypothetical protein
MCKGCTIRLFSKSHGCFGFTLRNERLVHTSTHASRDRVIHTSDRRQGLFKFIWIDYMLLYTFKHIRKTQVSGFDGHPNRTSRYVGLPPCRPSAVSSKPWYRITTDPTHAVDETLLFGIHSLGIRVVAGVENLKSDTVNESQL